MAYVDDVNCLLPIQDVKPFLDSFKRHGEPLGAVMNTGKTRILTSTHNTSTVAKLLASNKFSSTLAGESADHSATEIRRDARSEYVCTIALG